MLPRILALALILSYAAGAQRRGGPRGAPPEFEQTPPVAKSEVEKRILATINDAVKANET